MSEISVKDLRRWCKSYSFVIGSEPQRLLDIKSLLTWAEKNSKAVS